MDGVGDAAVVLITGATSGIGKVTAEVLPANGYRVFGTSRDPAGKDARGVELVRLDVTSDASVSGGVAEVAGRSGGRVDVLVNNAGTRVLGAAEEVTADEALRLFQVNLFEVMRVTRAVLPLMRARRSGTVINLSSSGGLASVRTVCGGCAAYAGRLKRSGYHYGLGKLPVLG